MIEYKAICEAFCWINIDTIYYRKYYIFCSISNVPIYVGRTNNLTIYKCLSDNKRVRGEDKIIYENTLFDKGILKRIDAAVTPYKLRVELGTNTGAKRSLPYPINQRPEKQAKKACHHPRKG